MNKESEEGGSLIHIIVHKLFMLMIYSSYLIRSQKRSGDRCIPSQNHTRLSLVLGGHSFFKLHVAHQSICYDKQGENKWHVIKHRYSSLFCLFDGRWISIYQFRFHCLSQSDSTNQNHLGNLDTIKPVKELKVILCFSFLLSFLFSFSLSLVALLSLS